MDKNNQSKGQAWKFSKEGIIEDVFEGENGLIQIEFKSEVYEIRPAHFQKVNCYIGSEAEVQLEVDMRNRKVISIEAKDPNERVNGFQEFLFFHELCNVPITYETLMHCLNRAEYLYSEAFKARLERVAS